MTIEIETVEAIIKSVAFIIAFSLSFIIGFAFVYRFLNWRKQKKINGKANR